jgi:hypothetical protein
LERLAQSDKLAMFQTKGWPERFWVAEPTISPNNEVSASGVDDSHSESKGRRTSPNGNLVQDLAQKCNPIKEPSHRGFDGRLQDYE